MEIDEARRKSSLRTLRVLLVISFVVSGLYLLSYLMMALMLPTMREMMPAMLAAMPESYQVSALMMERLLALPRWYFTVTALLNATSVVGLVLMWKLRKNGFHCYTLSKLLLMAMPLLFLDRSYVSIGDMMMAILFIIYYFYLLRVLGTFGDKNSVTIEETDINIDNAKEEGSEKDEK